jgi:hypothetical protein
MRHVRVVEWCVVIILAASALAIAVWSGRRSRPLDTTDRQLCAAQLRTLGQALRVYAADAEGKFPVAPTPDGADRELLPLLRGREVTGETFFCPALAEHMRRPYVYHCYKERGDGPWPKWMPDEHVVSTDSPADTWLMADYLARGAPGPHSATEKAFNHLCIDGRVSFRVGQPREVYK